MKYLVTRTFVESIVIDDSDDLGVMHQGDALQEALSFRHEHDWSERAVTYTVSQVDSS